MRSFKYLLGFLLVATLSAFALPKTSSADTTSFIASNVVWNGTTLNFDSNVDLTAIPAYDPGPYHDLKDFQISSSDGQLWQTDDSNDISCTPTHCTISNLTNYNGHYNYVTDSNSSQVQFTVSDSNDELVGQSQSNVPWTPIPNGPQVNQISGGTINEGSTFTEDSSFSEANATSWRATVDYSDGAGPQPLTLNPDNTFTLSHTYQNSGIYAVNLEITDNNGITSTQIVDVTVNTLPVSITQFSVDNNNPDVLAGTDSSFLASYTYSGPLDTHSASINWGDGTSTPEEVRESNGSGTVLNSATHTFTQSGSYLITLTITGSDGVAQTATTTVLIKSEPADYTNAQYVYNSAEMINSNTLTIGLDNMSTSEFSGIEICQYPGTSVCDTNFIVGSGGITYTITDGEYTSATINISPAFVGQAEAISISPLDSDGDYVYPTELGYQVVSLSDEPFAVSSITSSSDTVSVNVDSDYGINTSNAFRCELVGVNDSSRISGSVDASTNSCNFASSGFSSFASTNSSFYLYIDDEFDRGTQSTQDYNFSQFITPTTAPTNLAVQLATDPTVVLTWDSVPSATSYNIYRNGVNIGSSNSASFTDPTTPGNYSYYVTAVNLIGESGASNTVSVNTGSSPTITSTSSTSISARAPLNFTVTTTGSPTPSIAESGSLPNGITFTDNGDGTASFTGQASTTNQGYYFITLTATSSEGTATQSFILTVTDYLSAPTIISANNYTATYRTPFSFTVDTTGVSVPSLTKTGQLPGGVTFKDNNDGTATISGTPSGAASGNYPLTIQAKNKTGTVTQVFTLSVLAPPAMASIPMTTGTVGTPLNIGITTTGDPTASIIESGALPNGVTLTDNGDGTASITGTPTVGSGGSYSITVTANNSQGSASRAFVLKINEGPGITSANSASVNTGSTLSFQIITTGYPLPTLSESGALPTGINFHSQSGTITGVPKAGTAGTYPITITATNSAGTVTQSFTLTVQ
jgi:hypothetical protein